MPSKKTVSKNKPAKRALLKLDSAKKADTSLNSSKTVDEVTYYSLEDVELVIQAVLAEIASDASVGITLSPADTGITLNCLPENGDEYTVDVDLENEDVVEPETEDTIPEGEGDAE